MMKVKYKLAGATIRPLELKNLFKLVHTVYTKAIGYYKKVYGVYI